MWQVDSDDLALREYEEQLRAEMEQVRAENDTDTLALLQQDMERARALLGDLETINANDANLDILRESSKERFYAEQTAQPV